MRRTLVNSGVFKAQDFYEQILKNLNDKNDNPLFDDITIYDEKNHNDIYSRTGQFEDFLMRLRDDVNIGKCKKENIYKHLYNVKMYLENSGDVIMQKEEV